MACRACENPIPDRIRGSGSRLFVHRVGGLWLVTEQARAGMPPPVQERRRGLQVSGRQHSIQAALVQESQTRLLGRAITGRDALLQIGQRPGCLVGGPGAQVLGEAKQSELGICDPG